ncbi:MAG: hypothetical protein V4620_08225 [Bacteroidota bacterium]
MIKTNITTYYPHHLILDYNKNIYIADYTELTKNIAPKRFVEIFSPDPCSDNQYFCILNPNDLNVGNIIFDSSSFTYSNGKTKSQCESVSFPSVSTGQSWILFTELKYSSKQLNNRNNLRKAIKQLYRTRYHYMLSNVFKRNENICYLIASLPLQSEPFANFSLTPSRLTTLKVKHNIILRLKNTIEIENDQFLLV